METNKGSKNSTEKTTWLGWLRSHIHIDAFELVYIAISIATFQHTMWAAASTFEGPMPDYATNQAAYWHWHFNGALLATAIDVGMLVSARELAKLWNWMTAGAFLVASVASFYTQVLYSLYHTHAFNYGTGVTTYWNTSLTPFVDARVIVVPLMLPLFAVIYTLARVSKTRQVAEMETAAANSLQFIHNNRVYGPYPTVLEKEIAYKKLMDEEAELARRRQEAAQMQAARAASKQTVTVLPKPQTPMTTASVSVNELPKAELPAPTTPALPAGDKKTTDKPIPVSPTSVFGGKPSVPSVVQPKPPTRTVPNAIPDDEKPANWSAMTDTEKRKWRQQRRDSLKK